MLNLRLGYAGGRGRRRDFRSYTGKRCQHKANTESSALLMIHGQSISVDSLSLDYFLGFETFQISSSLLRSLTVLFRTQLCVLLRLRGYMPFQNSVFFICVTLVVRCSNPYFYPYPYFPTAFRPRLCHPPNPYLAPNNPFTPPLSALETHTYPSDPDTSVYPFYEAHTHNPFPDPRPCHRC
jgi:hypothetical protein